MANQPNQEDRFFYYDGLPTLVSALRDGRLLARCEPDQQVQLTQEEQDEGWE